MENREHIESKHPLLLRKITENIVNTLDIDECFKTLLDTVLDMIPADAGIILLKENEYLKVIAGKGFHNAETGSLFNIKEVIHVNTNELVTCYIEDINDNGLLSLPFLKENTIETLLFSPAFLHDEFSGLILLSWKINHEQNPDEESLVQSVAQLLSLGILNYRMYLDSEELRKSLELRFKRMPVGCIVWDIDFKVVSWNPAAENIFGYREDEVTGKHGYELLVPEENHPQINEVWQNLMEGKMEVHTENKNITRDGKTILCRWTNTPFTDFLGNVIGAISMVEDVTELKETQTALTEKIFELSKKNRYEHAERAIVENLHKTTNTREVMENAVEVISHTAESVDNISIYLVEGKEAVLQAHRGYPEWFIEKVRRIPYPKGFTWKTIIDASPRYVNDISKDKVIGPAGRKVGTRSYASMPISYEGEVIGVININSYVKDAFSDDEIMLLESVTHHVETAINNARKVEKIRRNEERFSAFMEHLQGRAFIKDLDGKYLYANKAHEKLLNIKKENILGKTDNDVLPGKIAEKFADNDKKVIRENRTLETIEMTGTENDKRYWFECKFPIYNGSDIPKFLGGVAIDITERELFKQRLEEQAALLDIANDAIIVRDLDDNILYWNKGAQNLYEWKEVEVMGEKAAINLSENQKAVEGIFQTVQNEGKWTGELTQSTKHGIEIVVMSTWTLVKDQNGTPKSIFIVNKDITENKKMQNKLLQSQRLESIGALAGGIAHDLNNALMPITMSIQMLREYVDKDDKKYHSWINMIDESANRGAELVKQVLSFARGVEGKHEALNTKSFVRDLINILQQTFPKSIDIQHDLSDEMWSIIGNVSQLHQVYMNLCLNARDAMPEGGRLKITCENIYIDEHYAKMNPDANVGHYVVFSVIDTGCGISEDLIGKIFDPFFSTKEAGKGTGLGLSTAFRIVKDHRGFLNVYSEPGKGTAFKIYLPADRESQTVEAEQKQFQHTAKGKGETILVVDDDATVREITKLTLENNGYNVLTAGDGVDAIALYSENRDIIDAVIMDTMMPNMDGPTSMRVLRRINPDTKIIVSSGLGDSRKPFDNMDGEISAILMKPYTSETLLKTIYEVVEEVSSKEKIRSQPRV